MALNAGTITVGLNVDNVLKGVRELIQPDVDRLVAERDEARREAAEWEERYEDLLSRVGGTI